MLTGRQNTNYKHNQDVFHCVKDAKTYLYILDAHFPYLVSHSINFRSNIHSLYRQRFYFMPLNILAVCVSPFFPLPRFSVLPSTLPSFLQQSPPSHLQSNFNTPVKLFNDMLEQAPNGIGCCVRVDIKRRSLQIYSRQKQSPQENVGGVAEADSHRMKPELDNRSIVELVYLASHRDEAVAALNLLDILLSGCLCGYLTQHCLGDCKPHIERGRREGKV